MITFFWRFLEMCRFVFLSRSWLKKFTDRTIESTDPNVRSETKEETKYLCQTLCEIHAEGSECISDDWRILCFILLCHSVDDRVEREFAPLRDKPDEGLMPPGFTTIIEELFSYGDGCNTGRIVLAFTCAYVYTRHRKLSPVFVAELMVFYFERLNVHTWIEQHGGYKNIIRRQVAAFFGNRSYTWCKSGRTATFTPGEVCE